MSVSLLELPGYWLARYLAKARPSYQRPATSRPEVFAAPLRKGDILLVEGSSRFSSAVKYLTQSTWSHAALCIVDAPGVQSLTEGTPVLVEADILAGVRTVPLSLYCNLHTRICRPVGLSTEEIDSVVNHVMSRLGSKYDLKNVFDLARYLIQAPPVPSSWRRRLIALGSGDPTRAICSSLIAEAFQSINYPILPEVVIEKSADPACAESYREILHIRHHSLYAPRDFDLSPYFRVIKPTIEHGFDPHKLEWRSPDASHTQPGNRPG